MNTQSKSEKLLPPNANQDLLGLIGNPLTHSLSPQLHNYSAMQLGLNIRYLPFAIAQHQVSDLLVEAWQDDRVLGFNVTTPYKSLVASLLTGEHEGAVNTLFRGNGSHWSACSTDGVGFERALERIDVSLAQVSKLVFLGNGGAVLALLHHLEQYTSRALTFPEIVVLRRNAARDSRFAHFKFKDQITLCDFNESALIATLKETDQHSLLVQATNAPLRGHSLQELVPCLKHYSGSFVDLLYGCHHSSLYYAAQRQHLRCQDGLPMLVEQARASQQIWWGQSLDYAALVHYLSNCLR